MTAAIVGHVTCPFCGNDKATVHREARGKRALYFRCYDGPRGRCGTVQIRYEGGQAWILENMRPLDEQGRERQEVEAAGAARAEAREVERQAEQVQKAASEGERKAGAAGIVGRLVSILGEE